MKKMIEQAFSKLLPLFGVLLLGMLMLACFKNTTLAQPISLKSVSILPDDKVLIKYDHTGGDITGIIVRYIPDLENLVDYDETTIEPPFDGEIIIDNPSASGYSGVLNFLLRGEIDGVSVPATDYHSTIFLEEIESVSVACELGVHASWMNYTIIPNLDAPAAVLPFDSLQILMYEYDSFEEECDIETGIPIFQFVQSYGDDQAVIELPDDISPGTQQYCFRVMSYSVSDPDLYAYSNMITGVQISDLDTPDKLDLISVDVVDNEHIEVQLEVDDFGFGQFEYTLFRSDNINTGFEQVLPPREHESQDLVFIDETMPDLQSNPWFYYVEVDMKECPGEYDKESNRASSIFLQAEISPGFDPEFSEFVEINLSWEHDPNWDEYVLKRQFSDSAWEDVPNFNYTEPDFSFTDEVDVETAENGISYILEAENAGLDGSISSNIATIGVEIEDVYINPISVPHNALRPDSDFAENKVFLPDQFDDLPSTYNMSIYDRNGLLVFSTNDHEEAWDGTINGPGGNPAPAGAYIYHIGITDLTGDHHEKKGVVYLVR